MRAQDRPILPYLYPQATLRVSPIFRIHPYWHLKDGLIIHAESAMQFFYAADGAVSFIIIGVEKFTFSRAT